MKRLVAVAMMAVLCGAPAISLAETPTAPSNVAGAAAREARDQPASDAQGSDDDASAYAAREKAAPQLKEFSGGRDGGVYLTTTALVIVLLVVLILVLI